MAVFATTAAQLWLIPLAAEVEQPAYQPPPNTRFFVVPREVRRFGTGHMYSAERTPNENPTDYGFDWGKEWLPPGVSITSSTWTITNANPDVDAELEIVTSSFDVGSTTVWITGGAISAIARVTNHITTDSDPLPLGQERTFEILVVDYR